MLVFPSTFCLDAAARRTPRLVPACCSLKWPCRFQCVQRKRAPAVALVRRAWTRGGRKKANLFYRPRVRCVWQPQEKCYFFTSHSLHRSLEGVRSLRPAGILPRDTYLNLNLYLYLYFHTLFCLAEVARRPYVRVSFPFPHDKPRQKKNITKKKRRQNLK